MSKRRRKRQPLRGTVTEHADSARKWLKSAQNNFNRHGHAQPHSSCFNIEHMTDVVAEATVATIEAYSAGDLDLQQRAEKLTHQATVRQREYVSACRARERALVVTGQEGNYPRRRGR